VFYVKDQVTKMCQRGLFQAPDPIPCDKAVTQGGLRITTTLDLGMQDIGQRIVSETIAANEERYGGHNGSLVAMRPGTGEILTYVGSRDFNNQEISGQVDIATSLQSHGSTMKVLTYLTGFEQGWVPSTYIKDEPLFLQTGSGQHQVNNWNFAHQGNITVRKALAESVNTSAVRAVMDVGIDEMRGVAHRLGITDLNQSDCGPTITLGSCEVKLVDMVFAYSTIDNNGVMRGRPSSEDLPEGYRELDPVSVLKIEDASGNILYQFSAPEERQVVDPANAYMITDILSKDAINWSRLTIDRPAASKTGTSEEFRDGLLMGYTPDLVAGVWMGNADNTPMTPGTFSAAGPGPMWRQFMQEAHAYLQLPPRPFEPPPEIVKAPCGGKEEVFKLDSQPTKPGACRPPAVRPSPGAPTPVPTPKPPTFPLRNTPTPTPSPTPEPPTPTPVPTREPNPAFYTVQEGDTLESIAEQFGVPLFALLVVNDLAEDDFIVPGQVLIIPAIEDQ
jgi:membrane peptidoglycan carboxypeptidase